MVPDHDGGMPLTERALDVALRATRCLHLRFAS